MTLLANDELVAAALVAYLNSATSFTWNISVGWVGNEPLDENKPTLAIEPLTPRNDFENARVDGFTVPAVDADPVTNVKLDFGSTVLGLTGNLYMRSERNGKTERAKALRQIERAFAPREPGVPAGVVLVLGNDEHTRAHITLEDIQRGDSAEGIRRDEWRAILKFEARYALETTVQKPFCRTIQLGDSADNLTPIDTLLGEEP
ncbi:hypothetical protein IT570_03570 [Candidatus Sumerlaeota bacterium]|nr:hypothetical protein [Candidatus Sumerlaeota bacterium]